jgi:hypothetical protein
LKWKCSNIELAAKTTTLPAGFKQTWLWQVADRPPLIPEPGMPAWREVQPSLIFSPVGMKTWPDLGRWFYSLYNDRVQSNDEMRRMVAAMCPADSPPYERLRRLYLFVRNEIRYVAVTIGIGGYQPHPAAEVFRNRYGDCKDKVALLQAMAECAGVEVSPVLISTWQNGAVDTAVVSHTHFNHVIARARLADSSVIWMDPTSRFAPFDELPWFDRDRLVYAIDKAAAGEWLRTPAQAAADHQIRRRWQLTLANDRALARFSSYLTGAAANDLRTALQELRQTERIEYVTREIKKGFPSAEIGDVRIEHLDHEKEPVLCSASFSFPLASGSCLGLSQFGEMDFAGLLSASRMHALQFRHPQGVVDSIEIRTGDNWSADITSLPVQYAHRCGNYQCSVDRPAGGLVLVKQFILNEPLIPLQEYASFYSMLRNMAETDRSVVVLQRSPSLKNN